MQHLSVHQVALFITVAVDKVFKKKLTENPGKAKVTEFDDLMFGDEDIFRFDVSVNALQEKETNEITILKAE